MKYNILGMKFVCDQDALSWCIRWHPTGFVKLIRWMFKMLNGMLVVPLSHYINLYKPVKTLIHSWLNAQRRWKTKIVFSYLWTIWQFSVFTVTPLHINWMQTIQNRNSKIGEMEEVKKKIQKASSRIRSMRYFICQIISHMYSERRLRNGS